MEMAGAMTWLAEGTEAARVKKIATVACLNMANEAAHVKLASAIACLDETWASYWLDK